MTDPAPSSRRSWREALAAGRRGDLARALTAVESAGPAAEAVLRAAADLAGQALVVGVTGAPGVGKSTLVAAYAGELRRRGLTVGVLAVDPSSRVSGGALLGDRIRMAGHDGDPGVFVRSLAARGQLGGLAGAVPAAVEVMDAAGRDVVAVETVGVGQSELAIADLADVRVVVWAPGAGDAIQAAKAGILEIADVIVVNKADLPQAAATEAFLRAAASHASPPPTVLATAATVGRGIAALADAIAERGGAGRRSRGAERRLRQRILAAAAARVERDGSGRAELAVLAVAVRDGRLTLESAAQRLLTVLADG